MLDLRKSNEFFFQLHFNKKIMDGCTNFIEFEGNKVSFLLQDGKYWVSLKRVCEQFDIDFDLFGIFIVENDLDDKVKDKLIPFDIIKKGGARVELCIPEINFFQIVFNINLENEKFKQFVLYCYEYLYNHFKGSLRPKMPTIHVN